MECRKVEEEGEECEVHVVVVGASSFYQNLRFALLASSWLPRPLGILVWSALHLLLVFSVSLLFVLVVVYFAFNDACFFFPIFLGSFFFAAAWDIGAVLIESLRWFFLVIWVIISCQVTPGKAAKVAYERSGGIILFSRVVKLATLVFTGGNNGTWCFPSLAVMTIVGFFRDQEEPREPGQPGESLLPLRLRMKRWCEEIVPRYDVVHV